MITEEQVKSIEALREDQRNVRNAIGATKGQISVFDLLDAVIDGVFAPGVQDDLMFAFGDERINARRAQRGAQLTQETLFRIEVALGRLEAAIGALGARLQPATPTQELTRETNPRLEIPVPPAPASNRAQLARVDPGGRPPVKPKP